MAQAGVKPYIKRYQGRVGWWLVGVPAGATFVEYAFYDWGTALAWLAHWFNYDGAQWDEQRRRQTHDLFNLPVNG